MKRFLKNRNYYYKEVLAFLFLLLAIYFFSRRQTEIRQTFHTLKNAENVFIGAGILITFLYIALNGLMYTSCFRAVQKKISLTSAITLFLKRNLVSVFLPGGGVTSLAFFSKEIEKQDVSKTKINFASYLYAITGIGSLIAVAIPILCYEGVKHTVSGNVVLSLALLVIFIALLSYITYSFLKGGWVYKKLVQLTPQAQLISEEIRSGTFSVKHLVFAFIYSTLIEFTGIVHMYIAMLALHIQPSLESCMTGYVIATIFLAISPFLRGLGAVEISLAYILTSHGYTSVQALSITILYRTFEFWIPLLCGVLSFLFNKGNIILRLFPAILIFLLGVVNIISVLTPPIAQRVQLLLQFLPQEAIHASNIFVLMIGIVLIVCAAFLIKGLRNAWLIALVLSVLSLIGHITKAIDYEEALVALFAIIILLATNKQYYLKGNKSIQNFNILTAIEILGAVIIYGVTGFYFLAKRHFGIDFSLAQSIKVTLESFVLLDSGFRPLTRFASRFIYSINILGISSILLLLYAFIKPFVFEDPVEQEELLKAQALLKKFGRSPMDYFKIYNDKNLFFSERFEAFVSYKFAGGYAVALEEPVCEDNIEIITAVINEFEAFCFNNNLKTSYYRIDEKRLHIFSALDKKSLIIGQEAIVDTDSFTLEGRDKKSLRNALNSLSKKRYKIFIHESPLRDGLLQKLKSVSDEWLIATEREEMTFAEGMFNWEQIKLQTVITLENDSEKVFAFLNIIPDYKAGESTYDLIRKTQDAPSGNMDALIIEMIKHCKAKGIKYLNMGLAPMSGIEQAKNIPERTIKFAYEKLQQFRRYQGLRDFKDKYNPVWQNKYLVYENHYDLLQLPLALNKVMKP